MNKVLEILKSTHRKDHSQLILEACLVDNTNVDDLIDIFLHCDSRLCQRAAIPLGYIAQSQPSLLKPHMQLLLHHVKSDHRDAIVRNILRTWQYKSIPLDMEGKVYDLCFTKIIDPTVPIAIKVFSMTICTNIANNHPTLKNELATVIQDQLYTGSAGILSRAKRLLKSM